MAPATAETAAVAVVAGRVKTALGVAACERDAEKLELIEELTKGFDAVQEKVLAAILARNNGAEYLRRHGMEGRTDRDAFKARVPVVTYEDTDTMRVSVADVEKALAAARRTRRARVVV